MTRNAYLLLTVTMLLWAGNANAGKLAVGHISPMLLNALRWLVAAVLLGLFARRRLAADWATMHRHLWLLALLGFLGMTVFGIALYAALSHTSAINVTIEQASMPMVVFVANYLFFRMPVDGAQIVGFLLSLVGVAVTVSHGDPTALADLRLNLGDAIMLTGVLAYGAYTVLLRFRPPMSWQGFMFALMLAGFVTSVPFAVVEWVGGGGGAPTARGWALVAYAGLFPSLLAQALFVRGVDLIGANRAGLFINLVPIFGTLLSILILGEAFHAYHAVALVLVLGGIALAERRRGAPAPD